MTGEPRATAAICAQPVYEKWARENRASMWDYSVEGENDREAAKRRRVAVGLCAGCEVRTACEKRHEALTETEDGARVPGVWGGRVYAEKAPRSYYAGNRGLFDEEAA